MLDYDPTTTTYSDVALWFNPHDPVPISKTCVEHQPRNIGDNRVLLTLHQHIVGDEAGYSPGGHHAIQILAEILHELQELRVVLEEVGIVERRIVVWWACNHEVDRAIRDLLHRPAVGEDNPMESSQSKAVSC